MKTGEWKKKTKFGFAQEIALKRGAWITNQRNDANGFMFFGFS
jgi:hypothetical protein